MSVTDFPIENLPFGVFRRAGAVETGRVGLAFEDSIVDLSRVQLSRSLAGACSREVLNPLMSMGAEAVLEIKSRVRDLIDADLVQPALVPVNEAEMLLPAAIGDYTDFYASIHHATRVGRLFRPENPLLANYKYVPIAYHGRASSIVVSGTPIKRPCGQTRPDPNEPPAFGPTRKLDYELEVAFFIGRGNRLGEPIPVEEAEGHIFGFCLLNDWSARDIQSWEYQPLGPFLGKNFATTVSPWVVTMDALEPFRVAAPARAGTLPYLRSPKDRGFDITLEVYLQSSAAPLSRGNFQEMYWTPAQMIAHHSSNGCNLRTGDLLASGTVSGVSDESRGCLLELGTRPFLEDGEEVVFRGFCERPGQTRIGFGECRGKVV